MIPVTRPDGSSVLVNPDRIETVEETPDTVITLADGKKLLVRETAAVVAERFRAYQRSLRVRRAIRRPAPLGPARGHEPGALEHPNRGAMRAAPRLVAKEG